MMNHITQGSGPAETSALSASTASKAARAKGSTRRKVKNRVPVLAAESIGRSDRELVLARRKGLHVVRNFGPPKPENIESLAKYKPDSKKYQVSLTFFGEAGAAMNELMRQLKVDSPNEVVKLTIALLVSARGKEILLKDRETGEVEVVEV
jgi:hypothetical protein